MKSNWSSAAIVAAAAMLIGACAEVSTEPKGPSFHAGSGSTIVNYNGQGWVDGVLKNELCSNLANDGGTGQGVDIDDGYLLWILTANGATAAYLHIDGVETAMFKVGGTFKLVTDYYTEQALAALSVHAAYNGTVRGNVQLTVSHGCRGLSSVGAFCSPGFWKNNEHAWDIFDAPAPSLSSLFGNTVAPFTINAANLALVSGLATTPFSTVFGPPSMNNPKATYNFGGGAANNAFLGPFNAVAAYLTTLIPLPPGHPSAPGFYEFDPAMVGSSDHYCPLNAHGEYVAPPA
jgi:hypothetical protein